MRGSHIWATEETKVYAVCLSPHYEQKSPPKYTWGDRTRPSGAWKNTWTCFISLFSKRENWAQILKLPLRTLCGVAQQMFFWPFFLQILFDVFK